MTTIAKWTCTAVDLPRLLPAALERMQAVDEKRGPCVVISEPLTERFVQLYGGFRRPVVVDIPVAPGAPNAACVESIAAQYYGRPAYTWDGIDMYQAKFESSPVGFGLAALKAALTFPQCLAIPLEAELVVEEILAGMEKFSRNATS